MATTKSESKNTATAELPERAPAQAEIVQVAPAPLLEVAELPSAEEIQKRAERQIKIRKAYVALVAKELNPENVLVFGNRDNQTVYLPKKPCQDILSWARIFLHMGPMTENRYGSPDGEFIIFEVSAKLTDGSGREVDIVGNRSTRDDFFGSAGKTYVCPDCDGPLTRKKGKPNDRWDSNFCATHGKVKAKKVTHYLPLHDVDIASVRLSAVTNLYNHAVEAIGLMPTLKDLADAGMDVTKVKRIDFQQNDSREESPSQAPPAGSQGTTPPASQPATRPAGQPSQRQPAAPHPPAAAPQNGNGRVKGVIENVITRASSGQPLRTGKGTVFVRIYVAGTCYYAFDNAEMQIGRTKVRLFDLLGDAKPSHPVEFLYVKSGDYLNLKQMLRLGNLEWEEGTAVPVIRRDAPMDQRTPDWEPNGPDITDEDIPF